MKSQLEKQNGRCIITGLLMTNICYQNSVNDRHKINKWNISVDRIDSNKGYTIDNIQLICNVVNRMKSDLTDNELLLLCNNIYKKNFDRINKLILEKI